MAARRKRLAEMREERHGEGPGDHRAERRDDQGLEILERDPREDRRRAPDEHHRDGDDDRCRGDPADPAPQSWNRR